MLSIKKIFESQQTVFSLQDLGFLLGEANYNNLKAKVAYYVKRGYLFRIRKGIFVKDNFDVFELGCKMYTPSYISFETVLQNENLIFQYDRTIYLASYLSKKIIIPYQGKELVFHYRKIKDDLLYDPNEVLKMPYYSIASKERSVQDMLYLKPDFYFDKQEDARK